MFRASLRSNVLPWSSIGKSPPSTRALHAVLIVRLPDRNSKETSWCRPRRRAPTVGAEVNAAGRTASPTSTPERRIFQQILECHIPGHLQQHIHDPHGHVEILRHDPCHAFTSGSAFWSASSRRATGFANRCATIVHVAVLVPHERCLMSQAQLVVDRAGISSGSHIALEAVKTHYSSC